MLIIHQRLPAHSPRWDEEFHLTYEARGKSRLCYFAASGEETDLFLKRNQLSLADGGCLEARDDRLVRIVAHSEHLLHVTCASPLELACVAYHPNNRHVALQVGDGRLRPLDGYVLKAMFEQFGTMVEAIEAPSQPEYGAYGGDHHHSHHGGAGFDYAPRLHQFDVRR